VKLANTAAARAAKKAAKSHTDSKTALKGTKKAGSDKKTVKSGKKEGKTTPRAPTNTRAGAHARKPQVVMTPELIAKVLDGVALFSLVRVCSGPDMPNRTAFLDLVATDEALQRRYAAAMAARADKYAEETIEIADDGSNDTYVDADGMVKVDTDVVARSKLRIAARQWYAGKIAPKKYGDKVDLNHGVQPDNPLAALLAQVAGKTFKPVE
jgi:hypothetical protein